MEAQIFQEDMVTFRINSNIREQEIAKREKNIYRLEILQKEEEKLLNEQRSIFSTRTSPFGRITDALNLMESAKSYKDGVLVVNASKYTREVGSDYTAMGMEMAGKVETLTAISRAGLPRIEFPKNTGSGASKSYIKLLSPDKVYRNSQQVFINDGTPGGTTIADQTVLANQNGMVIRQTNLHTGETLTRIMNPVGDIVYSYSSYSSVVNPALLQIGRTVGANLLPASNSPTSSGGMVLKLNLQLFASKPKITGNELLQNINTRQPGYFYNLQNSRNYGYNPAQEYWRNIQASRNVGSVTVPIDFDNHIIGGEINRRGNGVGGHSSLTATVRIDRDLGVTLNGVRKNNISIFDIGNNQWISKTDRRGYPALNTMFPEWWTENRIKVENDTAYINRTSFILPNGAQMWDGITPSGIKVRGYEPTNRNPNATVYPKENQ